MENIRQELFETNSSSSHSIAINSATNGLYDTIVPSKDGTITLNGGFYSREWKKSNDPLFKLNYAAVSLSYQDPCALDLLCDVVCKHTGAKLVKVNINTDWKDGNSEVDHQSQGKFREEFSNEDSLKEFIFSPNSWLFLGGDGGYPPANFFDVDPNIKYTHKLIIKGHSQKFTKLPDNEEIEECIRGLLYEDKEFGSWGNTYRLSFHFEKKDIHGEEINSWTKLDQRIVIGYVLKAHYKNNGGEYIGEEILDTKEFKFTLKEIK